MMDQSWRLTHTALLLNLMTQFCPTASCEFGPCLSDSIRTSVSHGASGVTGTLGTFTVLGTLLWSLTFTPTCGVEDTSGKVTALIPGDITIGGLFPVHDKSNDPTKPCGPTINAERGIQRAEAMLYTIDEINARTDLLPGLTLGSNIMDTCSRDTYALEQALEYVRASMSSLDATMFQCDDGSEATTTSTPVAVAGVIGGSYSGVSIQVANLLRLFKIPQISYASTSAALSDKSRFEYFARTVPPDNFQARAMVDILQHFNWTFISTVNSEGDYGESGIDAFNEEARARNICISTTEKIPHSADDRKFDDVIQNLRHKNKGNARVVILFLRVEDAKNLLVAARRQNVTDHFVWVASDGWGQQEVPVRGNDEVAEGALTIELVSKRLKPFDVYFKRLTPTKNTRNPWFKEYWQQIHKCRFNLTEAEALPKCTGQEKLTRRQYKQDSKIQFVYDSVYAMAYALDKLLRHDCSNLSDFRSCAKRLNIDGQRFYKEYILNVSFVDKYGGVVQFDKQGDGLGRYFVLNYRRNRDSRRYEYTPVGTWTNGLEMYSHERVLWAGSTLEVPVSQCSKPCKLGEIKKMEHGMCCWICIACKPWEFVKDEFTCEECEDSWWPMADMKSCFELEKKVIKWYSVWAIVPVCLSSLGIIVTMYVMITFIKHRDTPIVKASGRELSFMLLAGFIVCYSMTYILLMKPSTFSCAIQRFGVGFGFSMCYASLLTKTNRISRIFHSASKSAKRPVLISPKSQVIITCMLISVQVIYNCIWLVLEPPGTRNFYLNGQRDQVILKCRIKDISFLMSLVYNMLLIIICTVYAVKTRKIPENFNESKFIGFTMYTTCIIWLAFIPIYFGTLNSFEIQTTTLCISISLSAYVALLCLFTPKMYIIVFQPEKNVRKLTMNSATYKKTLTSVSTTSEHRNHDLPPEKIKLRSTSPNRRNGAGGATETETDRDSMASLMFEEGQQDGDQKE